MMVPDPPQAPGHAITLACVRPPAPKNSRGGVKYRMLHFPGILDCTYHLHVSVSCAQGSSIAEYSLVAVKRDTCVLVCLYALRGFTRPSYISTW